MELDEPVSVELALDAVPFDFGTVSAMWSAWQSRLKGEQVKKPTSVAPQPDLVMKAGKVTVSRDGLPPARAKVDQVEAATDSMLRSRAKSFLKTVDDRERLLQSLGELLVKKFSRELASASAPLTAMALSELAPLYATESGLPLDTVKSFLPTLIAGKKVSCGRGTVGLDTFFSSRA